MAAAGFRWLGENWDNLPEDRWIAAGQNGDPLVFGESFENVVDQLEDRRIDPQNVTFVFKPEGAIA